MFTYSAAARVWRTGRPPVVHERVGGGFQDGDLSFLVPTAAQGGRTMAHFPGGAFDARTAVIVDEGRVEGQVSVHLGDNWHYYRHIQIQATCEPTSGDTALLLVIKTPSGQQVPWTIDNHVITHWGSGSKFGSNYRSGDYLKLIDVHKDRPANVRIDVCRPDILDDRLHAIQFSASHSDVGNDVPISSYGILPTKMNGRIAGGWLSSYTGTKWNYAFQVLGWR